MTEAPKLRPKIGKNKYVSHIVGKDTRSLMRSGDVNTSINITMILVPRMNMLEKTCTVRKCLALSFELSISATVGESDTSNIGTLVYPR